jgi:hypothetical protein
LKIPEYFHLQVSTTLARKINRVAIIGGLDRIDWIGARLRCVAHHPHAKEALKQRMHDARRCSRSRREHAPDKARKKFSMRSQRFALIDWKLIA